MIFTLPHEYLPLWRYNEALFARILFKASQETLLQLLVQQRHGGVTPGILIALHTWGRQLTLHPHTHCLVTAGGLDSNNDWKALGSYLVPSAVIRSVYRGKLQSFIKAAFDAGELILPPTMSATQFWSMYRSLYKKHWCVRIEERYAHGKGVVLYLARYCKGGPVDPRQLKQVTADVVKMSYLDHRDKRIKQQRLKPIDFITRLLQHVPPKGLHTIRYYGLYASASKLLYQRCRQECGTVESMPHASSVDRLSMVVYCKTCGGPAQLSRRWWSRRSKGISINKEALSIGVSGSVQQVDEPPLAGVFYNTS
nr:transposase [Denitrificimonas caeni]